MTASSTLVFTGPMVDGKQRGVRYMESGFLQISTSRTQFSISATTDDPNKQTGVINHSAGGNTKYLDSTNHGCEGKTLQTRWPWYDGTANNNGVFKGSNETGGATKALSVADWPAMPTIGKFATGKDGNFNADDVSWIPNRMDILWNFELNIAARTFDPDVLGTEAKNYTQLATGTWNWNGDAKVINNNQWVADNPSLGSTPLVAKTNGDVIQWGGGGTLLNDKLIGWFEAPHKVVPGP